MKKKYSIKYLLIILLALSLPAYSYAGSNTSNLDEILASAPSATWIEEGQGKHIIYIFFDPNCPSCQTLYKNLREFVSSKKYVFRWMPVAVVNITSLGKVAAILEADDPLTAFRKNEEKYHGYTGGLDEGIASKETELKLKNNEALLNKLKIPVIPSMLFKDKKQNSILIQGSLSPLALQKVFTLLP